MDTRIFDTKFNQIAFNTPFSQKLSFVIDSLWAYKGSTNRIYNIFEPTLYDSNINLNTREISNYHILNGSNIFYFNLTNNRSLLWGYDSPDFVSSLIDSFNLSDFITGYTNTVELKFSFITKNFLPLSYNIYLGSTDITSDYLKFENLSSGPPDSSALLFNSSDTPTFSLNINLTITDFTPGEEKCTFTWVN